MAGRHRLKYYSNVQVLQLVIEFSFSCFDYFVNHCIIKHGVILP